MQYTMVVPTTLWEIQECTSSWTKSLIADSIVSYYYQPCYYMLAVATVRSANTKVVFCKLPKVTISGEAQLEGLPRKLVLVLISSTKGY